MLRLRHAAILTAAGAPLQAASALPASPGWTGGLENDTMEGAEVSRRRPHRSATMSRVNPVPHHLHTVTARLVVHDGAAAIDFYQRAFGAEQVGDAFTGPDGELIHAELRIGDSVVMLTEDTGDSQAPARSPRATDGIATAIMATYWVDVDAAWQRAISAGAEVLFALEDHFYGDRGGRLRDPFGHQWMLSQHIEDVSADEMARRAAAPASSGYPDTYE
jgi:PhnB protein